MSAFNDWINNTLYSPGMGLAAGLLQAGGPSRMPVSLGQALGAGLSTAQQYNQMALQRKLQMLPLEQQQMIMDYYRNGGSQSSPQAAPQPTQSQPMPSSGSFSSNPLMDPNYDSNAFTSGLMGQKSNPLTGGPTGQSQAAPQSAPVPTGLSDPMQDPQYRSLSMIAAVTHNPAAQAQAGQRFQLLTEYNPQLQGKIAGAKAEAQLPANVIENLVRYAGRPEALSPGQTVVNGLQTFPNWLQRGLYGVMGSAMGGNTGAPSIGGALGGPAGAGSPNLTSSNGMAGVPTGPLSTGTNASSPTLTGQNPYNVDLQKALADNDAKYIGSLQDQADSAAKGQQNIDEMWQAWQGGLPTGSLAGFKVALQKGMNALGVPLDDSTLKQINNYEAFGKNQAQLGIQLAKQVSSRPSQFEFKYLNTTAVANPMLQKRSVPILLSQMEGAQQYSKAKADYVNTLAEKGVNPRKAADQFDMNASVMPFALQSLAQHDPATYMMLRQQMESTATGRAFAQKIEKDIAWMKKAGEMQ